MSALVYGPGSDVPRRPGLIATAPLFEHVREQFPLFQMQMRGRGPDLFFERGQAYWSQKIERDMQSHLAPGQTPAVPLAVLANFVTGTWVTLLKWWLDNKMPYSPERMDEIFQQLVLPGVQAALGSASAG